MTFEITFDVLSLMFLIIIPPVIVFSCYIALMIGQRVQTFFVGDYVNKIVRENNRMITENRELKKKLEDLE